MGCPGFEPGTNRLKAEYSTVELATLFLQSMIYCKVLTFVCKMQTFRLCAWLV